MAKDTNGLLVRAIICLVVVTLSFIVTAVVASEHSLRAGHAPVNGSGAGVGILIAYIISWPGLAIFLALLADRIYLEQRLTVVGTPRALLYGFLPIAFNFAALYAVSLLPYPANHNVLVVSIVLGVILPFVALFFGFRSGKT